MDGRLGISIQCIEMMWFGLSTLIRVEPLCRRVWSPTQAVASDSIFCLHRAWISHSSSTAIVKINLNLIYIFPWLQGVAEPERTCRSCVLDHCTIYVDILGPPSALQPHEANVYCRGHTKYQQYLQMKLAIISAHYIAAVSLAYSTAWVHLGRKG